MLTDLEEGGRLHKPVVAARRINSSAVLPDHQFVRSSLPRGRRRAQVKELEQFARLGSEGDNVAKTHENGDLAPNQLLQPPKRLGETLGIQKIVSMTAMFVTKNH